VGHHSAHDGVPPTIQDFLVPEAEQEEQGSNTQAIDGAGDPALPFMTPLGTDGGPTYERKVGEPFSPHGGADAAHAAKPTRMEAACAASGGEGVTDGDDVPTAVLVPQRHTSGELTGAHQMGEPTPWHGGAGTAPRSTAGETEDARANTAKMEGVADGDVFSSPARDIGGRRRVKLDEINDLIPLPRADHEAATRAARREGRGGRCGRGRYASMAESGRKGGRPTAAAEGSAGDAFEAAKRAAARGDDVMPLPRAEFKAVEAAKRAAALGDDVMPLPRA